MPMDPNARVALLRRRLKFGPSSYAFNRGVGLYRSQHPELPPPPVRVKGGIRNPTSYVHHRLKSDERREVPDKASKWFRTPEESEEVPLVAPKRRQGVPPLVTMAEKLLEKPKRPKKVEEKDADE